MTTFLKVDLTRKGGIYMAEEKAPKKESGSGGEEKIAKKAEQLVVVLEKLAAKAAKA